MKTQIQSSTGQRPRPRVGRSYGAFSSATILISLALACSAVSWEAFVKEREKVRKLEAGIAGLQATAKEQAAQLEKVGAQAQITKPKQSLALTIP